MTDVPVRIGKRLGDDDLSRLDGADHARVRATPGAAAVSGQNHATQSAEQCPYCGALGYRDGEILQRTSICWNCGGVYVP